jgi:drug/metabolite transporter (DMT)-like permease
MPSSSALPLSLYNWGILALLSLLWGSSFLFIEVILREWPPLMVVTVRLGIAALALHGFLKVLGQTLPLDRTALRLYVMMGLLNNTIPFLLIVSGQVYIGAALASILNATTPLFTACLAHILTDEERITGLKLAGILTGFLGVAIMLGASAIQAESSSFLTQILAQGAVLVAALSYGFSGIHGRLFAQRGISPLAGATGQITAAFLLIMPLTFLIFPPGTVSFPSVSGIAALLALGLVSTAFAYILFFRLLAQVGATNSALVTFLIPVSAIWLAILVLGETLEWRHIAGMSLITAGLILIDGRIPAYLRR